MVKQFYSGSKDRETVCFRTTKEIADWLHQLAFEKGKSLALLLTEHFEFQKSEWDNHHAST